MNEHGIEELIGTLYEMVQDAKNVPFSGDKCSLERERVLDLLDEISNKLPGELKQVKTCYQSLFSTCFKSRLSFIAQKLGPHIVQYSPSV